MTTLIEDEYSHKYRQLGWKIPKNLEEDISKPHGNADITADDVYSILSTFDDEVLWLIINNDKMTFCFGMENA